MLLKSFFSSLFSINCDKVIHLNQENCIFFRILIRLIRFFANIYLSLRCLLIIIYGKEKDYNRGRKPATAVATVGLLRGIFPSIIEQLERQAATNGSPLKFNKVENMQEVLDEIYEKCIAETNLREFAQAHLNSDGLPN